MRERGENRLGMIEKKKKMTVTAVVVAVGRLGLDSQLGNSRRRDVHSRRSLTPQCAAYWWLQGDRGSSTDDVEWPWVINGR